MLRYLRNPFGTKGTLALFDWLLIGSWLTKRQKGKFAILLELGHSSSPALGNRHSWAFRLRLRLPWFQNFRFGLELQHWLPWVYSSQTADCGVSQLPKWHAPIPHNKLSICLSIHPSIHPICSVPLENSYKVGKEALLEESCRWDTSQVNPILIEGKSSLTSNRWTRPGP